METGSIKLYHERKNPMEFSIMEAELANVNQVIDFVTKLLCELDGLKVELDMENLIKVYRDFISDINNRA